MFSLYFRMIIALFFVLPKRRIKIYITVSKNENTVKKSTVNRLFCTVFSIDVPVLINKPCRIDTFHLPTKDRPTSWPLENEVTTIARRKLNKSNKKGTTVLSCQRQQARSKQYNTWRIQLLVERGNMIKIRREDMTRRKTTSMTTDQSTDSHPQSSSSCI